MPTPRHPTATTALLAATAALTLAPAAAATADTTAPAHKAPFPCGQERQYYHHADEVSNAIDFNLPGTADLGTPALASAPGTVTAAGPNGGYGNHVVVDHGDGTDTLYAHLDTIGVAVGQQLGAGAQLGTVGTTGNSTGPHLHYEQRVAANRVPITLDGAALAYDGVTRNHTSGNC